MDFPVASRKEALQRGLVTYTGHRECFDCGDYRRFRLESNYCCWTCYSGETEGLKNSVSPGKVLSNLKHHNAHVIKAKRTLTAIPRVFGSYNTGLR